MESATEAPASTEAAPKKGKAKLYGVIAIGLVAGTGLGIFVIGPTLSHRLGPKTASAATAPKGEKEKGKEGEADPTKVLHVVDNLVLNPAGSNGQRFLMVNATFEMKDAAAVEKIKSHDAEVRDVLLTVLGHKTVEELTDVSQRESIKKEMIVALNPLFPGNLISRVYFPQFVIQ